MESRFIKNGYTAIECNDLPMIFGNGLNVTFADSYLEISHTLHEKFNYTPIFELKNNEITNIGFKNLKAIDYIPAKTLIECLETEDLEKYFAEAIQDNKQSRFYKKKPENCSEMFKLNAKPGIVFTNSFFIDLGRFFGIK